MRALIISDVHSNLEALQGVLEDAQRRGGFDAVWCLGDVVGYGPDPGPCIEMLAEQELVCVVGNHDYAALGRMGVETFNSYAAGAALWTREQLESDHVAFLEGLPKVTSSGEFCAGARQPARPTLGVPRERSVGHGELSSDEHTLLSCGPFAPAIRLSPRRRECLASVC